MSTITPKPIFVPGICAAFFALPSEFQNITLKQPVFPAIYSYVDSNFLQTMVLRILDIIIFSAEIFLISLLENVQTGSSAHPAFRLIVTGFQ